MKPGGGKRKGSAFENRIGHILSKWLCPGDGTQLIPTRLSGGWDDVAWRQAGDLAANGPEGEQFRMKVMVECKHQNKDLLWQLYTQQPGENIQGWWQKLSVEADALRLLPMLVVRQNVKPILVALPPYAAHCIQVEVGGTLLEYYTDNVEVGIAPINFGILTLTNFISLVPEHFYNILPQGGKSKRPRRAPKRKATS